MRVFSIDISQLVHSFLPPQLRHYSIRELVVALLAPASDIQRDFEAQQLFFNHQATYTNQWGSLHWALNDWFRAGHNGIFDQTNEAIYLEQNPILGDAFLFNEDNVLYASDELFLEIEATTTNARYLKSEEFTTTWEPQVIVWFKEPATWEETLALSTSLNAFLQKFMPHGISYTVTTY